MISPFLNRARSLILLAALFLVNMPWCQAQSPDAMATAHRWVAAKLLGEVTPNPPQSYLLSYIQSETVSKNEIEGHHFRIVNQEYSRGLHFPSDGKVRVVLSSPAKSFEAVVGVDSNDIGYYSVRPGVKEHHLCRFDEQRPHRRGRGEKLYRSFYM